LEVVFGSCLRKRLRLNCGACFENVQLWEKWKQKIMEEFILEMRRDESRRDRAKKNADFDEKKRVSISPSKMGMAIPTKNGKCSTWMCMCIYISVHFIYIYTVHIYIHIHIHTYNVQNISLLNVQIPQMFGSLDWATGNQKTPGQGQ
jgi:hypothetical protein